MLGVMSPSKLHSNLAMSLPVIYIGPVKSNVDDAIQRFDFGVSIRHGDVDCLVAALENSPTAMIATRRCNIRRARHLMVHTVIFGHCYSLSRC